MDEKFLDFIWDKESSKGTHPNKMATGGDYQIKRIMYDDVNRLSKEARGKNWTYDEVINDPKKGRYYTNQAFDVVGSHYIKSYKLPDTTEIKIGIWNMGIGRVRELKGNLITFPPIARKYIADHQNLFGGK